VESSLPTIDALQRRYDGAVIATNGLGLAAHIVEFSTGRLVATASLTRHARPGGTIPGPTQVTLIDGLAWLLAVSHLSEGSDAYTTDLSTQFMRAVPLGEVSAVLNVERLGCNRAVVSTVVSVPGEPDRPISHLVLGFALRRNDLSDMTGPATR
jgi:acyl-coenzyme A thioesterase PaaI-like protein